MPSETSPSSGRDPLAETALQPVEGTLPDPFPGEFRLHRRLGHGAFGEVWLAEDLSPLTRMVALKFLRPNAPRAAQALAALQNEARVLATLRHPHIVGVHAWRIVAETGEPCLVLQYVPGGSLDHLVTARGPLPWHRAARYIADCADGLREVHRRGVIHRDIKPANLLYDSEPDEALLTDFGIASRLADPTTIGGTLRYMPPEAFAGELSPALDVYGLAASLFALISGSPPFDADNVPSLIRAVEAGLDPDDEGLDGLPPALEELIRAGLAARPDDRPDLSTFARTLRGDLNLLLADSLAPTLDAASAPVALRLLVSRQVGSTFVPITATAPPRSVLRDMKRVPRTPERVTLHTGDRLRIEVVADCPGHVAVFNVGPTGNLNLFWPTEPGQSSPLLPANQSLPILDIELTPPAGTERLIALWTRKPMPLHLDTLRRLASQESSSGSLATRDLVRVCRTVEKVPLADRRVVVLELDHQHPTE